MSRAEYEIAPEELREKLGGPTPPVVVDVRRQVEVAICSLQGALHLPMDELQDRMDELDPEKETVVVCHHGVRSLSVTVQGRFLVSQRKCGCCGYIHQISSHAISNGSSVVSQGCTKTRSSNSASGAGSRVPRKPAGQMAKFDKRQGSDINMQVPRWSNNLMTSRKQ